jgi:hypothetical protein
MVDLGEKPDQAAIPLSGSRISPAHDRNWVESRLYASHANTVQIDVTPIFSSEHFAQKLILTAHVRD